MSHRDPILHPHIAFRFTWRFGVLAAKNLAPVSFQLSTKSLDIFEVF